VDSCCRSGLQGEGRWSRCSRSVRWGSWRGVWCGTAPGAAAATRVRSPRCWTIRSPARCALVVKYERPARLECSALAADGAPKRPTVALLSHRVSPAVPSPKRGLTSEFGMGSGVAPALWTAGKLELPESRLAPAPGETERSDVPLLFRQVSAQRRS
jgi:hypothetical protein